MFGISGDSNINKRVDVLDRWTPDNQDTDIPRAFQGPRGYDNVRPSTFFLQKRPTSSASARSRSATSCRRGSPTLVGAKRADIAVVGTNLLTFTGYSGINPEASSGQRTGSGNIDAASAPRSAGPRLHDLPALAHDQRARHGDALDASTSDGPSSPTRACAPRPNRT